VLLDRFAASCADVNVNRSAAPRDIAAKMKMQETAKKRTVI
jgi:hypothetical protein